MWRWILVGAVLVLGACGSGGETSTATTSRPDITSSTPTATSSSTTSTVDTDTPVPSSTTAPLAIDDLVLGGDGLGPLVFGDEADGVLVALRAVLGEPDFDTGYLDPSVEANEPLWPGCPGTEARVVDWTDASLSVVLTDWETGPLDEPGSLHAGTGAPYFAGYGVGPSGITTWQTAEGAEPGMTVAELVEVYGDRLHVSPERDEAVGLFWFSIDDTTNPLTKDGGIRGFLFEPGYDQPGFVPDAAPVEAFVALRFTAGVSCDSP